MCGTDEQGIREKYITLPTRLTGHSCRSKTVERTNREIRATALHRETSTLSANYRTQVVVCSTAVDRRFPRRAWSKISRYIDFIEI